MAGNSVKKLERRQTSTCSLQGTARQQMYCKQAQQLCHCWEGKPHRKHLHSCSSHEDPIFSHTSETPMVFVTWSAKGLQSACCLYRHRENSSRMGQVSKQARDLTLSCTKGTRASCTLLQAKTATMVMCSYLFNKLPKALSQSFHSFWQIMQGGIERNSSLQEERKGN